MCNSNFTLVHDAGKQIIFHNFRSLRKHMWNDPFAMLYSLLCESNRLQIRRLMITPSSTEIVI